MICDNCEMADDAEIDGLTEAEFDKRFIVIKHKCSRCKGEFATLSHRVKRRKVK